MNLFTIDEAAQEMKLNHASLHQKIASGEIPVSIHASNYQCVILPKNADVTHLCLNSNGTAKVTVKYDNKKDHNISYVTKIITLSGIRTVDQDCADTIVFSEKYNVKWLIPSKQDICEESTKYDSEFLLYVINAASNPGLSKDMLYISDEEIIHKKPSNYSALKDEIHPRTLNKYLLIFHYFAEYIADGLTMKPDTDTNAIFSKFDGTNFSDDIGFSTLKKYLTQSYSYKK